VVLRASTFGGVLSTSLERRNKQWTVTEVLHSRWEKGRALPRHVLKILTRPACLATARPCNASHFLIENRTATLFSKRHYSQQGQAILTTEKIDTMTAEERINAVQNTPPRRGGQVEEPALDGNVSTPEQPRRKLVCPGAPRKPRQRPQHRSETEAEDEDERLEHYSQHQSPNRPSVNSTGMTPRRLFHWNNLCDP